MIECLDDLIRSEGYQVYANESVYSLQDHCINPLHYDTDSDTMDEYNKSGMFGVTHNDVIENERQYLSSNRNELLGRCECEYLENENEKCEPCQRYDEIEQEINELYDWHVKNGSIDDII